AGDVRQTVAIEIHRSSLVRPSGVDDRPLPRGRIGGRPEKAVDVDVWRRVHSEPEAADVGFADHDLRARGAVERGIRLAVHAEEGAGIDLDSGPLLRRIRRREEGVHLSLAAVGEQRGEDVQATVTVEVEDRDLLEIVESPIARVLEPRIGKPAPRRRPAGQPVPGPTGHDVWPTVAVDVGDCSAHRGLRVDQGGRPYGGRRGWPMQPDDLTDELIVAAALLLTAPAQ